jgi:O-antigen ligase
MNYLLVYIVFLLSVIFVPKLNSIDIIGPQWVYLSFLNLVSLCYLLTFHIKQVLASISKIFKNHIFILLFLFFALMLLSFTYSKNVIISIHDFSRHINLLVIFFNLFVFFSIYKLRFLNVAIIISFFLVCEVVSSMQFFFKDFYEQGLAIFYFDNINQNAFLGFTGNKNIAAASIVFKLPMLFYLIYYYSNKWLLALLFFITSLSFFNLFILSARAALLSLFIIGVLFVIYLIIKSKFTKLIFFSISTIVSIFLSKVYLPENIPSPLDRVSSIELTDESSSFRLGLWEDAIKFIFSHPFYGVGLGNWKVESAQFWKSHGQEYLVPYHAHNDFLEVGTEMGLVGLLLYFSVFCLAFYFLIFHFIRYRSPILFFLFLSLGCYFIDAFFNFPLERPIMQVFFGVILTLIIYYNSSPKILINENC